jgi:hypothetical protein
MRCRSAYWITTVVVSIAGCVEQPAPDADRRHSVPTGDADFKPDIRWAHLPRFFHESAFTCATYAEAVNLFVDLGEQDAVKELEMLASSKPQGCMPDLMEFRMAAVCRILFEPKSEPLRPPGFGCDFLQLHRLNPSEVWPSYPVVRSGASCFILSEGGIICGLPEPSICYLGYCRSNGVFRKDLLPIPCQTQALLDFDGFRQSGAWQATRGTVPTAVLDRLDRIEEFVRAQAAAIPALAASCKVDDAAPGSR